MIKSNTKRIYAKPVPTNRDAQTLVIPAELDILTPKKVMLESFKNMDVRTYGQKMTGFRRFCLNN